jgi:hypothetical protein
MIDGSQLKVTAGHLKRNAYLSMANCRIGLNTMFGKSP